MKVTGLLEQWLCEHLKKVQAKQRAQGKLRYLKEAQAWRFIMSNSFGEGLKDVFLAGVGAMAMTGEKAQELVDQLIAKGEITVEQGKQINEELVQKATDTAKTIRMDALETAMAAMTPEQRQEFAAKAAQFAAVTKDEAAQADAKDATQTEGTSCKA